MLQSPQVPTDSLYKFIAIFGLVIFIFSIYSLMSSMDLFYQQIDKYHLDGSDNIYQENKLFSKKLMLEEKVGLKSELLDFKYGTMWRSLGKSLEGINDITAFEKDYNELIDLRYEVQLNNDEEGKLKNLRKKAEQDHKLPSVWGNTALLFVGTLLMYFGFLLWYKKIQIYVDREMKRLN